MCRRRFDFQVFSARARLDWSGPVVGTHGIPKSDTRDLATPHKSKGQIKPIAAAPTRKILDGRLEPKDLADGVWNKRGRFAHFVPFFGCLANNRTPLEIPMIVVSRIGSI